MDDLVAIFRIGSREVGIRLANAASPVDVSTSTMVYRAEYPVALLRSEPMVDEPDPVAEMLSWSDDDWTSLRESLGVDLPIDRIRTILKFAESCGGLEEALEALQHVSGNQRAA